MKNFKVVICSINSKFIHSSLAPWCLLSGVRAYCNEDISAKVIEGTINEDILGIKERINSEKPSAVGFCSYIWNIEKVLFLASKIKKENPSIKIILGGPEVSYNAKEILEKNSFVDFIISGEGEEAFPALINSISNNEIPSSITGISYRNEEKIIEGDPAILNYDPPSPYSDEYFKNLNGRIVYLETSRGCPYNCAFCLSGRCGKARFFDLEKSKENIIKLANSGTQTVKFVDRTFNANKKRAKEIISFIIENYGVKIPKDVCFHFEIAGDILDEETITLLNSAPLGLFQLEIGMQSFNEETLKYINRKTNTKVLKENIKKLVEKGNMHIHIDLIAGLPLEDFESFKKSFNTGYSLKSNMLQLGFLKLLYGAPMREEKEKFSCTFNDNPPYEVTETPWLSSEKLSILHGIEDALDRIYNSGRFFETLKYLESVLGETPFDIFYGFSKSIERESIQKIPLDRYTELIFNYFSSMEYTDKMVLRDKLVVDRLSTNSSGKIPNLLKIEDKKLKKYKNKVKELFPISPNTIRGIAILYSENKIVFCDYKEKKKDIEKYDLKYISLDELNI